MWKRKRKRVPEVLWRLFRHRARTLAETIVSMIPSECNCKGRTKTKYLCCCHFGAEEVDRDSGAMYYLLRPDDPIDYKKLMNCCFVVVPDDASPLPSHFSFRRRWSQHQIVKKTIQTILTRQPGSPNLICSGYDKFQAVSSISKLLTSSAWHLVLRRIGDDMMNYMLMQTLIFLPLLHNKHHQVSGSPVSALNTFSRNTSQLNTPNHTETCMGTLMKRRRINSACMSAGGDSCGTSNLTHLSQLPAMFTEVESNIDEEEQSKKFNAMKLGKRLRMPSWMRHKKLKRLAHQDANNSVKENQYDPQPQLKQDVNIELLCLSCSVCKTTSRVPVIAQINRLPMFYNLEISSSLFLEKHVLNYLKPGFCGANYLFSEIFGVNNIVPRSSSVSLFHKHRYHSLLKLLKFLIYRAQCCQHLRLLDKHCPIPPLAQYTDRDTGSTLELKGRKTKSQKTEQERKNLEVMLQLKRSQDPYPIDCKRNLTTADIQLALNKSYCSEDQVVSFIWAACRSIVPPELLGGPSNWRILRRNIYRFVRLRRFEKFSLKQCIHKLKTSRFQFISGKDFLCNIKSPVLDGACMHVANGFEQYDEHNNFVCSINQYMFERWIFWFFSHIVVPLLQANFYITESEYGNQNLYLYRKSVWNKLCGEAIISLKNQTYRSLNGPSVRNILSNRSFGFSKVRFCPKVSGVRPIANLKSSSGICTSKSDLNGQRPSMLRRKQLYQGSKKCSFTKSVNSILRDLHVVLKDFKLRNPEMLGSSVFDYNDVYRKLCPFVMNLNKVAEIPATFIVVADVHKAFDTVNQDKLLSIINEVLVKDDYIMEKSWEVLSKKAHVWVRENLKLVDEQSKNAIDGSKSFMPSQSWHTVIVNKEQTRIVKKKQLTFILNELVKHNVLLIDQCFFLQKVGIPQGSIVSSLLCSFYYGHLEKTLVFPFLEKEFASDVLDKGSNEYTNNVRRAIPFQSLLSPGCLLVRLIDDFLFISTSRKQAMSLFLRLWRGFRDYNCYMNNEKFGLNFYVDRMPRFMSKRSFVDDDGISFMRWSGLLINCNTLEIQADFTRYLNNHLRSTLTVSWHGRPVHQLKAKLFGYMRPKCHPLFYDSNINSSAIVRLNIYQAFILCAMKFHSYVCDLSTLYKIQPKFYLAVIEKSLSYMHKLIKRRNHAMDLSSDFHPILELKKTEVKWLGLMAYLRVLKKKQSRHKKLLHLLKSELMLYESIENSIELKYAVDDSHSSLLWKIQY